MKTLTSTFEVSSVKRATEPLPVIPSHEAVNYVLSEPLRIHKRQLQGILVLFKGDDPKSMREAAPYRNELAVLEAEEARTARSVEACSCYHGRLVADVIFHPFIWAVDRAFTDHRPLCISPDMIWLLICQGVAHHVNVHGESLRSRFVRHPGKARITVRRDDFVKGSPVNPWDEVIDEFSTHLRLHIGTVHDLFVPRFSTTGPTERIVAEIVLLDAMQNYFDYYTDTLCGIPAITLEGTTGDWQELANRAQAFAEFDLEWWLTPLQPILDEFVAAARGEVRQTFWESIYKFHGGSGGGAVNGWLPAFFPYLKDERGNPTERNSVFANDGLKLKRFLAGRLDHERFDLGGPPPGAFPGGMSRAPFTWKVLEEEFDMEFLGGFVGVAQDPDTLTLRPEIGWAIREVVST